MKKKTTSQKGKPLGKWISRGLKKIVSLTLGESDFGPAPRKQGDLPFNPDCMEILEIDFDENKLPRPKVFKLNLQTTGFFNRVKNKLGNLNSLYLVYSDEVEMFYENAASRWQDRLRSNLNEEYQLELQRIHFIRESDILNLYNSPWVRNRLNRETGYIRNPYQLYPSELLIVAGGFINFKYRQSPLVKEIRGGITDHKSPDTIATIEVEFFKFKNRPRTEKIRLMGDYPVKYRPDSGAYFYIGGEWYHNLFVPEFYHPTDPRYICLRIDDDGRYIRFFPDSKIRHIPVCVSKPSKETGRGFTRLSYVINPEYLSKPELMDIRVAIRYESGEAPEVTEIIDDRQETGETAIETLTWDKINREINALKVGDKADAAKTGDERAGTGRSSVDYDALPFLLGEMILLPKPGEGKDDISGYELSVGEGDNFIKIEISGPENRISLSTSEKKDGVITRKMDERIDYSKIIKGHEYSLSNRLVSSITDEELSLYFGWSLESTKKEKTVLEADHIIIGRDPLRTGTGQRIELNRSRDTFWRIGSSRNHAFLRRGERGHTIYNISTGNPIYILKPRDLKKGVIDPVRIEPISGEKNLEKYHAFISKIPVECGEKEMDLLPGFSRDYPLQNNDLVIIGNRVFLYVLPLVIESRLEGADRGNLKSIQIRKNIR